MFVSSRIPAPPILEDRLVVQTRGCLLLVRSALTAATSLADKQFSANFAATVAPGRPCRSGSRRGSPKSAPAWPSNAPDWGFRQGQ